MSSDLPDDAAGAHPPPEPAEADPEPADDVCVLSPQLRAALRQELSPSSHDRARVRGELWSALGAGGLPGTLQRVDESMAVRAAGVKSGAGVVGYGLVTKVVVAGLAVIGAISAATSMLPRSALPRSRSVELARPRVKALEARAGAPELPQSRASDKPTQESERAPTLGQATLTPDLAEPGGSEQVGATRGPPPVARSSALATRSRTSSRLGVQAPPAAQPQPELTTPPSDAIGSGAQHVDEPVDSPPVIATGTLDAPPAITPATVTPAASAAAMENAPSVPTRTLTQELALVRAAFQALDHQQPIAALELSARYLADYPQGALIIEAESLRALSLCEEDRDGGAAARDRFLQQYGTSALAERVRRACLKAR